MTSRRTIIKMGVWAVPVATIVSAAPAFATSNPAPVCAVSAEKHPGNPRHKAYTLRTNCGTVVPDKATVDGIMATPIGNGVFYAPDFGNSRSKRNVVLYKNGSEIWAGEVKFPPSKRK